jgi:hypothetical protein
MTGGGTAAATAHVLPPRPNPGPEPWAEPRSGTATALSLTLAVLALGIAAGWLRRRRARRRRAPRPGASRPPAASETPMAGRAARVREALMARFGPSWGAKTTEEIAAEPGLADRLGPLRAEQLVRFLLAADRAKFAGDPDADADAHSGPWDVWVDDFVAEAGAMSRTRGR